MSAATPLAAILAADHRRLDDLFGRFLAAPTVDVAAGAIRAFDDALRRHTGLEDEHLFSARRGGKLVPPGEQESAGERLSRELALEHVQIREVSGMMRRLLVERGDLAGARALAGKIARRWDAHTAREEGAASAFTEGIDPASDSAIREALGSGV